MKSVVSWIMVLAAFMPLFVSNTLVPAIDGKVLVIRGIAFALAVVALLAMRSADSRKEVAARFSGLVRKPIFVAATAGIVSLGISTVFAFDRYVAFFGELVRGEGFLTLVSVYAIYVFLAVLAQAQDWRRFWIATVSCGLVMVLIQLGQTFQGVSRPSGTLGNPIFLAGYCLFVMMAGVALYGSLEPLRDTFAKWAAGIGFIVGIIGCVLTGTRGTLLGLAIAGVIAAIIAAIYGKSHVAFNITLRNLGLGVLGLMIAGAGFFAATFHHPVWKSVPGIQRVVSVDADETLNSRVLYLGIVQEGFADSVGFRKAIGWGWDNFSFFANRYYDPRVYQYDSTGIDRPHNKLADMLVMTGILGLVAYLALWVTVSRKVVWIGRRNVILGIGIGFILVAYFVHTLFAFDVPVTWFYFYAFLAWLTQYEQA